MWVDYFHYHVHVVGNEIELFVKLNAFQLLNEANDRFLFNPRKDNIIRLDLHTGTVLNPNDTFCFFGSNRSSLERSIAQMVCDVKGFEFELEQAYEKALFHRAMRKPSQHSRHAL